jgi:hypothetical protein
MTPLIDLSTFICKQLLNSHFVLIHSQILLSLTLSSVRIKEKFIREDFLRFHILHKFKLMKDYLLHNIVKKY